MKPWHLGALTVIGLGIGAATHGALATSLRDVTLALFLPVLILEAAWQLDVREMRAAWRPISLLALPGVVVTASIIAVVAHYLAAFSWQAALVLGAVLSATDPVAVVAIFRRLRIPARLTTIIESEALLNDAVAVVIYRAVLGGTAFYAVVGSIGAVLVGFGMGALAGLAMDRRSLLIVSICVALIVAYASYGINHHFGWSGIFGVLSAGLMLSYRALRRAGAAMHATMGRSFALLATTANIVLFVLIGAAVDPFGSLRGAWLSSTIVLLAMLLARIVVAYGLVRFVTPQRRSWLTVIRLAGVRGALSLALVLALPVTLVQRDTIIDAVFVCVIVTVLVASLSSPHRIEQLKLHSD